MGLSFLNQFRSQLFSIFKEQDVDSIKFLGVLRQTPSNLMIKKNLEFQIFIYG
jgi:hypothetical protein